MAPGRSEVVALKAVGYDGYQSAGAIFEMRNDDIELHEKLGLVKKYDRSTEPASSDKEVGESLSTEELLEKLGDAWDVDMTPENYLEKFPAGPKAELAKRIVEVKAKLETES